MASSFPKETLGELLDYSLTWFKALGTDVINDSTWTVSDPSLTIDHTSFGPYITTIWLTGGVPNQSYLLINTATTAGGRRYVIPVSIIITTAT